MTFLSFLRIFSNYQNRKRIPKKRWGGTFSPLCTTILLRILSLSLSLSPFLAPFPPRHHIIVNVFLETWYAETPFSSTSPPLRQLTKIISTFIQSKISCNLIHLTLNPLFFPATPLSSPSFYPVTYLLIYRKTQKVFDLSNFPHISIKSHWQHRVPWLSHYPSLLADLLGCILCLYKADVSQSSLVSQSACRSPFISSSLLLKQCSTSCSSYLNGLWDRR